MRKKVGEPKGPAASNGFAPLYTPQKPPSSTRKVREHTYVCLKCKRTFALLRHHKKHMQGHEKNDCELCDGLFTSRKQLMVHMREKHNKRIVDYQHKCSFCDKCFTRKHALFKHFQIHAKDKVVCLICGGFCDDQVELEKHMETHEEIQFCCPLCHQNFIRRQQYNAHLQSHEKYQCLTCKKGFSAWKVLLEHQQSGHNVCTEKPSHKCDTCNKKFIRVSCLNKHKKKHSVDNRKMCKPCNRTFISNGAYENHLHSKNHRYLFPTNEQQNGTTEFQCEVCQKYFGNKKSLSVHQDRVHHSRAYECHICQYRTKFKTNLTRHIKLHFNDRTYVCELCGSAFFNMSALKDHHTFLHTDSRDFVCSSCSKSFKRSSELTRHMKSHSDSRPYACVSCEKTFKRSSHLKRHREKCHNDQSSGRMVDRFFTDENGQLVLKPVEKKPKKRAGAKKQKLEQLDVVCEDDFDNPPEQEEESLNLAPILSTTGNHYYMSVSTESHQDPIYISSSQSQPINLQICLEQPIDLEMPKNYSNGETLDLAKPKSQYQSLEISHLLETGVRPLDDFFPRQMSPQTPLYLTELSRYPDPQMPVVSEFRHQSDVMLNREDHPLSMASDLIAEDMRIQQHHLHYL